MKFNINYKLYITALLASLSMISLGAAFAWTSPVLPKLNGLIPNSSPFPDPITKNEESLITSIFSLGSIFGPILVVLFIDKIGKIKAHQISSFCMITSYIIKAFAPSVEYIYAARFILGVGCGSLTVGLQIYLSEIAENSNRGSITCITPILFNAGVILVYAVGPYVTVQVLSLVLAVPALLAFLMFAVYIPESPYFLIKTNEEAAKKSLRKVRNNNDGAIENEINEIKFNVFKKDKPKGDFKVLFTNTVTRKSLLISLGVTFFSQTSGNTAILAYMQLIFAAAKVDFLPAEISSLIVGCLQMAALLATSQIIDRFGRRTLLLFTTFVCLVALGLLGTFFCLQENNINVEMINWMPISCVITFMIVFRLGLGPLPMLMMTELFPAEVKSLGATVCVIEYFILNFLITFMFPIISAAIGMGVLFLIFSGFCGLGLIVMALTVPETKGKSFNEIQVLLNKQNSKEITN